MVFASGSTLVLAGRHALHTADVSAPNPTVTEVKLRRLSDVIDIAMPNVENGSKKVLCAVLGKGATDVGLIGLDTPELSVIFEVNINIC
jgi:hypothetical protein